MKKNLFKLLAKINKAVLPSLAKQQVDMSKATKLQLALIGWDGAHLAQRRFHPEPDRGEVGAGPGAALDRFGLCGPAP